MKKKLTMLWLLMLFSAVITLFWYNSWVYLLPTPVPANYKHVAVGSKLLVHGIPESADKKPRFLHFFNPECPCSKFNINHFRSLVRMYGKQVDFAVVVMSEKKFSAQQIKDRLGLDLPVIFDAGIASECGVYSTPQAVLINSKDKLFYRGNYNKSRYCTDERTNYAKIALAGLLGNSPDMAFDDEALRSYGCSLPYCKK
ncbi:TlpA family protein disulfide reductase [Dyadobacter psychrotolerans]|uniref:AhpC/TSA family protein n=1 Tax=Dyadobacter psychrotolerans TaxID=2541721 RepID=A0A4R5DYU5_9BACT|nr:AhpC/TSA family protein [Dyadobacter psychrotolerans]TDE17331.1 AhpC/TSA family protein [Dyadobacter psychrotolerans]